MTGGKEGGNSLETGLRRDGSVKVAWSEGGRSALLHAVRLLGLPVLDLVPLLGLPVLKLAPLLGIPVLQFVPISDACRLVSRPS